MSTIRQLISLVYISITNVNTYSSWSHFSLGSASESFSLLNQSISHPVCSKLQMCENTNPLLMKPSEGFLILIPCLFARQSQIAAAWVVKTPQFLLSAERHAVAELEMSSQKSETENTKDEIQNIVWNWSKATVCFGPHVQWVWMNPVITDIQAGKCEELCRNMLRGKMLVGFCTLPQNTSISTSNRIQQWPTYIGVKILLKSLNLQKTPALIHFLCHL